MENRWIKSIFKKFLAGVVSRKRRERYGVLFTLFIFAFVIVLIVNLITLNKNRFERPGVTKIYFADNMSRAHLEIIRRFNQLHAGEIEIIPIDLPFSKFSTNERKELIARSLRSRSSRIDIFAVDQIWVPRFVKWGEPLSKYFMQTDLSRIVPQALQTCYCQNTLIGIPLYIDLGVLYYRRDLLERVAGGRQICERLKASIAWGELLQFGQEAFAGKPIYLFQGDSYEGLICNYFEILGNMGGEVFQDGKIQFNTPAGRRSAQFMLDLIKKYHFSPPEVTTFNERESYYYALAHDAPFFRGWSSFLKDMPISNQDSAKVRYLDIAMLPHFDQNPPVTIFGGWNLMISKYSTKKLEAYQFLKFVLEEETQKILFETSGYLPILMRLYEDPEIIANYPYIEYLKKMMATGRHRPMLIEYTKISDILSFYLNKVLKGEMPVETALSLVDETIYGNQPFLR